MADSYSAVIRKVTPVGSAWEVNTIGGLAYATGTNDGINSTARFNAPYGVCANAGGILFVADTDNETIRAGTPVYVPSVPSLTTISATSNAFGFSWNAQPGTSYQIQYKTNVLQAGWNTLVASLLATNRQMQFVDSAPTNAARFYRIVVLP